MARITWVYNPRPAKLNRVDKELLLIRVRKFFQASENFSKVVNRIAIRGGRIYIYHLIEPYIPKGRRVQFTVPLIESKYLEFPMARITLFDNKGSKSALDWQRHTGQWIRIFKGSLNECLHHIESHKNMFHTF